MEGVYLNTKVAIDEFFSGAKSDPNWWKKYAIEVAKDLLNYFYRLLRDFVSRYEIRIEVIDPSTRQKMIFSGVGALSGVVSGAALGFRVAGPLGALVAGILGGIGFGSLGYNLAHLTLIVKQRADGAASFRMQ